MSSTACPERHRSTSSMPDPIAKTTWVGRRRRRPTTAASKSARVIGVERALGDLRLLRAVAERLPDRGSEALFHEPIEVRARLPDVVDTQLAVHLGGAVR